MPIRGIHLACAGLWPQALLAHWPAQDAPDAQGQQDALRTLLELRDPERILRDSGYDGRIPE